MTPIDVLARALAAALLDGPWDMVDMRQRLERTIGSPRPWMLALARSARAKYREPPTDLEDLTSFVFSRDSFGDIARGRLLVRHYATPAPEMTESPWHVPALATSGELAMWLGIDRATLAAFTDPRPHREQRAAHYRYAWIAKPLGGHRLVEAPKVRLRTVQRDILDGILAHIPPHDAAHGFRAGRSVIGFAAQHVQREVVVRVDLQAFFSSVIRARVAGLFRTAGYPRAVAHALATLCTHRTPRDVLAASPDRHATGSPRDGLAAAHDRHATGSPRDVLAASPDRHTTGSPRDGLAAAPLLAGAHRYGSDDLARLSRPHLPQGAPTSGALANLAAYRLDVRVTALAAAIGAHYSRYADDLVISGDRSLVRAAPSLIARLGAIAIDEGFALNFKKTRVMTAADRQRITGLVVNDKLSVPRAEVDRLRAILHNCVRSGPESQNREAHADFRAHLRGRVEWVAAVDPKKGERLRATWNQIRWPVTASGAG